MIAQIISIAVTHLCLELESIREKAKPKEIEKLKVLVSKKSKKRKYKPDASFLKSI